MADQENLPSPAIVGDVLPDLIMPNAQGNGRSMSHQSRAGRWLVLVFVETATFANMTDTLAAAARRMEAIGGHLYSVLFEAPNPTIAGADFFDESRNGSRFLFGAPGPGIAILSPVGRLAAKFAADDVEAAVAFCEEQISKSVNTVSSGQAPVLLVPGVLEPDLCAEVIDFWHAAPKRENEISSRQLGNEAAYAAMKRRTDVLIPKSDLYTTLRMRIARRVLPLIDRAFRMSIASMEVIRVGRYTAEDQGAFTAHRDNTTDFTVHRRFAMSLNLNAGEYEGGQVRFPEYSQQLYSPETGGAVVFSCALLHEALPVTQGERFGIFTFFTDAAGLEIEKRNASQRRQNQPVS